MEVNMEILIGIGVLLILIAIIVFEVFIYCALKLASEADKSMENTVEKHQKVELTDEEKKKQEKLRKNFENLMGFDYEKALKSKGE
jgi:hypothetical protein